MRTWPQVAAQEAANTRWRNRGINPLKNNETGDANAMPSQCLSESESETKKNYGFFGAVIRLTDKDLAAWKKTYHGIPDLLAELTSLDGWCALNWSVDDPKRKGWFHAVQAMLNRKHQEAIERRGTKPGHKAIGAAIGTPEHAAQLKAWGI